MKEMHVYEKNRFRTKKSSNKRKFQYIVSNPILSSRVALLGCQMRWAKAKYGHALPSDPIRTLPAPALSPVTPTNSPPPRFLLALINSLRGIDASHVHPYVDFLDCLIRFNPSLDMPFDLWKHLASSIIRVGRGCHEKLATSLLRLTCTTIEHLAVIQYNFIEEGLAAFVSDVLRNDIEALRVTAMESVQRLCLGRVQIQAALFSAHVHEYLFSLLNKYHTKFLKKTTIHAIWAIAGDDVLQRQVILIAAVLVLASKSWHAL